MGILESMRKLLRREPAVEEKTSSLPPLTGRVIEAWNHTGWGDNVHFWPEGSRDHIVGWLSRKPVVGDEIRFKMRSGRVGRYVLVEVEYMQDPPDMWSGRVEGLGYVESTCGMCGRTTFQYVGGLDVMPDDMDCGGECYACVHVAEEGDSAETASEGL
jgi:hypothetical protein